jgi:acetolactate synthase-1/2/3 large subunit
VDLPSRLIGVRTGQSPEAEQHGGALALSVVQWYGVETMFTLSGAHVFPLYDAAVHAEPPLRIIDVRHEQTAVFAAEATAKLTRRPGLAVLTAGPGVTNGVSAIAQAHSSGIPLLVLGGRAPAYRWGSGALQELDHPPLLSSITRYAATAPVTADIQRTVSAALHAATTPPRGPAFVDVPMDQLFAKATRTETAFASPSPRRPSDDDVTDIARLLTEAQRPVIVIGTDVWTGGADAAALRLVEATAIPVITNGMGRGVIPRGHPLLVTKARSIAFAEADLVMVIGTPLDFRLNYGSFGRAQVVHIATPRTNSPVT